MKKIILATVAIAFVMAAVLIPSSEAYTWYSNRDTVSVPSYEIELGWLNASIYYGDEVAAAGNNMTGNWSLPTTMDNANNITITIFNNGSTVAHCNLTVNGTLLLDNSTDISGTSEQAVYLNVSNFTVDYMNLSFNANTTDIFVNITIKWVNATVTKTEFITGEHKLIYAIRERYKTEPTIEFAKSLSFYTVEDRITVDFVDYPNLTMELYNVTLNISYPSNAINNPVTSILLSDVNDSMDAENYFIGYQKYGPYVSTIGTPTQNPYGDYELGMRIKSFENEYNCDWEFDPTSTDLSEYFPYIDLTTLEIEIDGNDVDFETGSIVIEDIDLDAGYTSVEFTWTPAVTPPPVGETELGISTTTWIIISIIAIVLVILLYLLLKSF